MASADKWIRRSVRALKTLALNTAERIETAQTAIARGTYDANQVARDVAGQALDALNVWLDGMRVLRESPPSVFIDLLVSGRGTAKVSGAATVRLDESIADMSLLGKTELSSARSTIGATQIDLTNLGSGPQVDGLKIRVSVPNNQKQGLYHGFVTTGSTVQVEVRVSIHS